jgi:hypothetical protein
VVIVGRNCGPPRDGDPVRTTMLLRGGEPAPLPSSKQAPPETSPCRTGRLNDRDDDQGDGGPAKRQNHEAGRAGPP